MKLVISHPSIVAIDEKYGEKSLSNQFETVTGKYGLKRINIISAKQATGIDGIYPKLLHISKGTSI